MGFEAIAVGAAFLFGASAKRVGLPPLVGFLAAGFAVNAFGPILGAPPETGPILTYLADLGVLLLLFTVGLKLKIEQIAAPHVVGGALAHFVFSVALYTPIAWLFFTDSWYVAMLVGVALAFSSTVLAAKVLEAKRELGSFHGRAAIGVLIVQDIIALAALAAFGGKAPGLLALLAFASPLLRPVLYKILDLAGHDEVLIITGMAICLVIGGVGFEMIGLKGEIGALVMGLLLSNHPRASEMSQSLWALKEVFLVGFFLSIGMSGLPDLNSILFAILFALFLPIKGAIFFFLLVAFKLRARTSFLTALSLTAYSEFGLIVAAGIPEAQPFLVPMAIAIALSFLIAAPLSRLAHPLFERFEQDLLKYERDTDHPDEQPHDLGDAQVIVFGMGRTGSAAYKTLEEAGKKVVGLDADVYAVKGHMDAGRNVIFADAEDSNFWNALSLGKIEAAVLAMNDIEAKLMAAEKLRAMGFTGVIVSHALFEDHVERILKAGADDAYLTMAEAGRGLAANALEAVDAKSAEAR